MRSVIYKNGSVVKIPALNPDIDFTFATVDLIMWQRMRNILLFDVLRSALSMINFTHMKFSQAQRVHWFHAILL